MPDYHNCRELELGGEEETWIFVTLINQMIHFQKLAIN